MNQRPSSVSRRTLLAAFATVPAGALLAACGGERAGDGGGLYHNGRLSIATGQTTGVYYVLGGGLADLITKHVKGYQATAEATGASVENIQRVARGDSDIGFTLADTAADAATGKGVFQAPQPIRALARIYNNYTHVIARTAAKAGSVADLKGKRVSTGAPNSGTEVIALRLLKAAGLDPDSDISKQSLGLPETVQGMKEGTVDAMFWSGGLPTGGVTDLVTSQKDGVRFVPVGELLQPLQDEYGTVYQEASIGKDVYQQPADVPSIGVPNFLVVSEKLPDQLAYDVTKLLFDYQDELVKVHPEAKNIARDNAPKTEPVKLHPGAKRYYDEA
ncbi:MAG: TAXI family TRAP transporter solute-binding subunit [Micromonosporaceae bacterium]